MKTKFTEALDNFYKSFLEKDSMSDAALIHYESVLIEFNNQMFDSIIQREFAMALARGALIFSQGPGGMLELGKNSITPNNVKEFISRCDSSSNHQNLKLGFVITDRKLPITEREHIERKIYQLIGFYSGADSIKPEIMPTLGMLIAKRNELEKLEVMGIMEELNEIQPAS